MQRQKPLSSAITECEAILQTAQQVAIQQQKHQQKRQKTLLQWGIITLIIALLLIVAPWLGADKGILIKIAIAALVLGGFSLIRCLQDRKQGIQTLQKRIQRFFRLLVTNKYQPQEAKAQHPLTWQEAYKIPPRPVFLGVAAYLAKQLGVSVRLLRLLFFIAFFISGGSVIFLYILVGLLLAFVKDE